MRAAQVRRRRRGAASTATALALHGHTTRCVRAPVRRSEPDAGAGTMLHDVAGASGRRELDYDISPVRRSTASRSAQGACVPAPTSLSRTESLPTAP